MSILFTIFCRYYNLTYLILSVWVCHYGDVILGVLRLVHVARLQGGGRAHQLLASSLRVGALALVRGGDQPLVAGVDISALLRVLHQTLVTLHPGPGLGIARLHLLLAGGRAGLVSRGVHSVHSVHIAAVCYISFGVSVPSISLGSRGVHNTSAGVSVAAVSLVRGVPLQVGDEGGGGLQLGPADRALGVLGPDGGEDLAVVARPGLLPLQLRQLALQPHPALLLPEEGGEVPGLGAVVAGHGRVYPAHGRAHVR